MSPRRSAISALIILIVGFVGLSSAPAAPMAIGTGHLVVLRLGDGATGASASALPVTLDDYSVTYTGALPTSVTLVQSIPVQQTTATSGNRALTQTGNGGGEGGLLLSGNGAYVTFTGYNVAPTGTTTGGTEERVIGRLDLSNGAVDTSTALTRTDVGSGSSVRGVYSADGSSFYLAASSGDRYVAALGASTSTLLNTGTVGGRRILVNNGQLYGSESTSPKEGVETIGSGTPTNTGNAVTLLPGFPTANASPYDFFFANSSTIYVADDGNSSTIKGLEKWVFNGSTWSMLFNDPVNGGGIKGLTGSVDASGNVSLFATTVGPNGNFMYGLSDTLSNTNVANVSSQQLVNASTFFGGGSNWNLRGLAIVPEPTSLGLLALTLPAVLRRRRQA